MAKQQRRKNEKNWKLRMLTAAYKSIGQQKQMVLKPGVGKGIEVKGAWSGHVSTAVDGPSEGETTAGSSLWCWVTLGIAFCEGFDPFYGKGE